MTKSRIGLSILWALVPLAVTAMTVMITSYRWGEMARGFSPDLAYWFTRASPLPALLFGPLAGLVTVFVLPLHRRRPVAMMSLTCFIVVAGYYGLREYVRLSPSVDSGTIAWDDALSYLDAFAVFGAVVGFVVVAVSARISVVVAQPVKRAKQGAFGNADWLSTTAARKLFPADGEIVVGERYRVDRELIRDVPFDPQHPETWGTGGTAPLLTYKQNFDSTHMLFFAGSGGFKTTSNVVPTALRYTGPLVCLDGRAHV